MNRNVVDCRLFGIYKLIKREDYKKAFDTILDTILQLRTAKEIDIPKTLLNDIMTDFHKMWALVGFKRYEELHNCVRDLHYKMFRDYYYQI